MVEALLMTSQADPRDARQTMCVAVCTMYKDCMEQVWRRLNHQFHQCQ